MDDLLDIILSIVIALLCACGAKVLESIKKRFGKKEPDDTPPPLPAEHAATPPVPRQPFSAAAYGFTAEEEGRGWSATEQLAAAEAPEAGSLATGQVAPSPRGEASAERLAAHRRRWRRAMIDSIVLGRP